MEWWSEPTTGLIGGGIGGFIGVLGAAVGVVSARFLPKGRGKPAMVAILSLMLAIGVASLGAGIVALLVGQPYHVFYPLLLIGGIGSLVAGINTPVILNRYRQVEARRISAEELRRS